MKRLTIIELYSQAERRITHSRLPQAVKTFALDDSFTDAEDHLRWLLTAPLCEIRDWAEHCIEAAQ